MKNNMELLHDLRMPLQLMYSCAQLLECEVGDNAPAKEYVQMLMGSALEIQRMLSNALDQNRLESGRTQVHFQREDIVARSHTLFAQSRIYAQQRGLQMSFHTDAAHIETALDYEKFDRILLNLISNALKFTQVGGVHIEVRALSDFAEISVSDTGCGIDPSRLERIFRLNETDGGYGYGLHIARAYAEMMGGTLTATSEPRRGSRFTLRLPVRSVESAGRQNGPALAV